MKKNQKNEQNKDIYVNQNLLNIISPSGISFDNQQCSGKNAQVVSFEREDKKKKAPLLFSLADLQKEMGKKYKYSPDHTLEILQVLYEKYKIVSYPRTDSSYLTLDLYNEITEHIKSCNFGKFAAAIEKIDLTSIRADKSYFNDAKVTDHHALIPTINDTTKDKYDSLSVDEKNVFDAIVYRFLAIFYPPYEYGSTTLVTRIDDLYFRSRGISVKALGYKEILQEKDAADAENSIIPLLHTGETAEVKNVECVSKKTSPPPKYTVDSIITLMQKYGIGTSATMAEIVKKLQNPKRQSIVLENGVYSSTAFGRKFISVVPDELKSPELTKNIEEKLSQIGEGSLTKEDFLNDIIQDIRSYIDTVKGEADDLEKEMIFLHSLSESAESAVKYDLEQLSIASLTMDVDFFIIGEVKGTEAMYLINAAYTGQISAATVHSLSAQAAPEKIVDYALQASGNKYNRVELLKMIADCYHTVINVKDYKVYEVMEIDGWDDVTQSIKYKSLYHL